jgi:hypothetical protein
MAMTVRLRIRMSWDVGALRRRVVEAEFLLPRCVEPYRVAAVFA